MFYYDYINSSKAIKNMLCNSISGKHHVFHVPSYRVVFKAILCIYKTFSADRSCYLSLHLFFLGLKAVRVRLYLNDVFLTLCLNNVCIYLLKTFNK